MTRLIQFSLALGLAAVLLLQGCATGSRSAAWTTVAKPSAQAESNARYSDGVISEMNGDTPAAVTAFTEAVGLAPDNEELVLDVTQRFLQYRQPQRALELLTNVVSWTHASGELYSRLGGIYTQLGQIENAIKANQAAVRKSPTLLAAQQALYVNYCQTKNEGEAFRVLEEAALVKDTDAEFRVGIAELYLNLSVLSTEYRTNAQARARSLLQQAAGMEIHDTQTQLKLAEGLGVVGDTPGAIEAYRRGLERLDQAPQMRNVVRGKLAELYLRAENRKQAAEQLEALLRDDPMNAQATFVLGRIAKEENRQDQAADYFKRTVLLNPKSEQAWYELATAQIAGDHAVDAVATLEEARTQVQATFFLEYLTGVAYSQQKKFPEALKHYTTAEVMANAADSGRLTYGFYFQLGVAAERTGDLETAARYFEKCLNLSPDAHEAQNYLGYMWAEKGVNLERAQELIERAVKAQPENAAYLDSLGWLLFKRGKPQEALPYMERALQRTEEPDATLFDHIGDIHAALSEMDKAREAWRKSLELESNDAIRKKLEAK